MVKIVDFKTYERTDGTEFNVLIVQGKVEAVKSRETGRTYLTARKANVSSTFDAETCRGLIGTELSGTVEKVTSEPYEYTVPSTGEIITLQHTYQYVSEEEKVMKDNLVTEPVL